MGIKQYTGRVTVLGASFEHAHYCPSPLLTFLKMTLKTGIWYPEWTLEKDPLSAVWRGCPGEGGQLPARLCDCRPDVQHCEGCQRHGSIPERLAVGDDGTASPRPSSRSGISTLEYMGIRQYAEWRSMDTG
ncbi:uncharacterized protein LOC124370031 isoform X2 [Homalodisca vitripennis]|uniref:uncharacterized protein LOC124370031 isoform X2 n=1 Tax=Homalodisca vitripennis TaxID=197043 RepID=UPI001EEC2F87|nr:uncharacterized protein LOC124370031 isoform X2 [Homalodisca vitripennis]